MLQKTTTTTTPKSRTSTAKIKSVKTKINEEKFTTKNNDIVVTMTMTSLSFGIMCFFIEKSNSYLILNQSIITYFILYLYIV